MPRKREKQENAPRESEEEILCDVKEQNLIDKMSSWEIVQALCVTNRIAEIFLTVPDDEVYGDVVTLIIKVTKSKYGLFGYIRENSDLVIPSLTKDIWNECKMLKKDIVYPRDTWGGIWGRAIIEQKTLYTNEPLDVPKGHVPILRDLVVPIIHQKVVVGLFQVANKSTDYDKKDIRFLETIANHTAPILHARLQRDVKERDRKRAEEELMKRSNEMLRFNKLAVHRELKMMELKKEINALLVQLGEEPRYKIGGEACQPYCACLANQIAA